MLSQKHLKEVLNYDQVTGVFHWNVRRGRSGAGNVAGSFHINGYIQVGINGKLYKAHRLAFLYMTGGWPEEHIDHINGNNADNRWKNLRDTNAFINQQNQRQAHKDNYSGFLGVTHDKRSLTNPWIAAIWANGKHIKIGYFATPEEAHQAYLGTKRQLHEGCSI